MTTIFESNNQWMQSETARQVNLNGAETRKMKGAARTRKIPFALVQKALVEFQKKGKSIRKVAIECHIPKNFLLKRIQFLARFFFQWKGGNDSHLRDKLIKDLVKELKCELSLKKATSLIESAEPFAEGYRQLLGLDGTIFLDDMFDLSQQAPVAPAQIKEEWDPLASESEIWLPQSFKKSLYYEWDTPTYWDWPAAPQNETLAPSENRKRKTPAVPEAAPCAEKRKKSLAPRGKKTCSKFSDLTQAIREYQEGKGDVKTIAINNGLSPHTLKRFIHSLEKAFEEGLEDSDLDDLENARYSFNIKKMKHLIKIATPKRSFYLEQPLESTELSNSFST